MILADTMLGFLIVTGVIISFNAIWLLCRAIWTGLVDQAIEAHHHGMVKSFFLGLPMTAFLLVLGIALMDKKQGPWGAVGIAVISFYFIFASVGVSALASFVGRRLRGQASTPDFRTDEPLWKETLRGGSILSLSFLLPLVGWFVIMPIAFVTGCGATIRANYRQWKAGRPQARTTNGAEQSEAAEVS